jgi:hypothetical protein
MYPLFMNGLKVLLGEGGDSWEAPVRQGQRILYSAHKIDLIYGYY